MTTLNGIQWVYGMLVDHVEPLMSGKLLYQGVDANVIILNPKRTTARINPIWLVVRLQMPTNRPECPPLRTCLVNDDMVPIKSWDSHWPAASAPEPGVPPYLNACMQILDLELLHPGDYTFQVWTNAGELLGSVPMYVRMGR